MHYTTVTSKICSKFCDQRRAKTGKQEKNEGGVVNTGVYCVQGTVYKIHYVTHCTGRTQYIILYHCMHNAIIKIKNITYIKHYYVYNNINYYLLHCILHYVCMTHYYIICLLHFIYYILYAILLYAHYIALHIHNIVITQCMHIYIVHIQGVLYRVLYTRAYIGGSIQRGSLQRGLIWRGLFHTPTTQCVISQRGVFQGTKKQAYFSLSS